MPQLPARQPVGSNEMANRAGGPRGEQRGMGENTTQPLGFLRPGGQEGPQSRDTLTQAHPQWLLLPLLASTTPESTGFP